jgi:hypothetical protein
MPHDANLFLVNLSAKLIVLAIPSDGLIDREADILRAIQNFMRVSSHGSNGFADSQSSRQSLLRIATHVLQANDDVTMSRKMPSLSKIGVAISTRAMRDDHGRKRSHPRRHMNLHRNTTVASCGVHYRWEIDLGRTSTSLLGQIAFETAGSVFRVDNKRRKEKRE